MKLAYLITLLFFVAATPNGGVLDNDTDPDGDAIVSAVLVQLPQHGSLTFNQDGTFAYMPNADFYGVDMFTYRPVDETGAQGEPTTVTITVNAVADPPVGTPDNYETDEDAPLVVPPPVTVRGYGGDYLTAPKGSQATATYNFAVEPGLYRVSATWPVIEGAADNTQFRVKADSGLFQGRRLNQRIVPDSFVANGAPWKVIKTVRANSSIQVIVRERDCTGTVVADAIRIEKVDGNVNEKSVPRVQTRLASREAVRSGDL